MDLIEELKSLFLANYENEHPKPDQDPKTEIESWAKTGEIKQATEETEETAAQMNKNIQQWAQSQKSK